MGLSDDFYLIDRGTIVSHGSAAELSEEVIRAHLAV